MYKGTCDVHHGSITKQTVWLGTPAKTRRNSAREWYSVARIWKHILWLVSGGIGCSMTLVTTQFSNAQPPNMKAKQKGIMVRKHLNQASLRGEERGEDRSPDRPAESS